MYHRKLNIFIATRDAGVETLLRGAPPVERFSCQFFRQPNIREGDIEKCAVIVLDFDDVNPASMEKILAAKDEEAVVVGCFSAGNFPVLAKNHQHFDQVWIKPFDKEKVLSSFSGVMERLKQREESVLTQKYLDTLIDSLPDLIWFKDARGAHLKVNDSFCRAVNKTKAQIAGRVHYYIWDLEPDEYA